MEAKCWLCGAAPVVASTVLGGVCSECFGDGEPLMFGPDPNEKPRQPERGGQ